MSDTQTQAQRFLDNLLIDLREDEDFGDGTTTYSFEERQAESYMLAGNGPSAWAWFVLDDEDEIDHAYIEFADSGGVAFAPVPNHLQRQLLDALRGDVANQPR